MDIDTLRSVAEASKIKPEEDRRDVEERREARWAAVEARRVHAYAMNLEEKRQRIEHRGSKETLSDWQWALLEGLHDDSLRKTANDLTIRAGNGTIRRKDGTLAMLGSNTHSHTRRVLDRFEPLLPEQVDLSQYM